VGGHEGVVEVAAALGRTALDEVEVVRGEHRHPEHPEQVPGLLQRLAVHQHAVAAAGHQLRLDEDGPALALALGPDDGPLGPLPHERLGGRAPERRHRGQPRHCLEEVGLALAVVAEQRGQPGRQRHLGLRVRPEVREPDPVEPQLTRTGIRR
jgi:hypothetical protein